MIIGSIPRTKFTKEALVKDKYQKNQSEMNTKNEVINDMDIALVNYKGKTRPSKATEDTQKNEESELAYKFQGHSAKSQHQFDLDYDLIEDKFMTMEPSF